MKRYEVAVSTDRNLLSGPPYSCPRFLLAINIDRVRRDSGGFEATIEEMREALADSEDALEQGDSKQG